MTDAGTFKRYLHCTGSMGLIVVAFPWLVLLFASLVTLSHYPQQQDSMRQWLVYCAPVFIATMFVAMVVEAAISAPDLLRQNRSEGFVDSRKVAWVNLASLAAMSLLVAFLMHEFSLGMADLAALLAERWPAAWVPTLAIASLFVLSHFFKNPYPARWHAWTHKFLEQIRKDDKPPKQWRAWWRWQWRREMGGGIVPATAPQYRWRWSLLGDKSAPQPSRYAIVFAIAAPLTIYLAIFGEPPQVLAQALIWLPMLYLLCLSGQNYRHFVKHLSAPAS